MQRNPSLDRGLHRRLVDGLYVEAMVMADEARTYFHHGDEQPAMDPLQRVAFTCESLKVTTRLMHVIAWLLGQRAYQRGELTDADMLDDKYRLGAAPNTDPALSATFPFAARSLVEASEELYGRVLRLEDRMNRMAHPVDILDVGPARMLMDRLSTAF